MKLFIKSLKKSLVVVTLLLSFNAVSAQKPAATKPDNFLISMEKGGCFGTCPVYNIKVYPNGQIVFDGKIYVQEIGTRKAKLNKKKMKAFKKELNDAKIFDFNDVYTENVPDGPTTTVMYNSNGKSKKITDYMNAPHELKLLEQLLIDIANNNNWLGDPNFDYRKKYIKTN